MARRRGNAPEQGEGARHAEVRPEAPEQEEPPSDVNRDDVEPLSAPLFQAGTVALQVIGNEFIIIFQRALRAAQSNRRFVPNLGQNEPVAAVSMAPQLIKDLSLILSEAVREYEEEFGEVQTSYTKHRAKADGQS